MGCSLHGEVGCLHDGVGTWCLVVWGGELLGELGGVSAVDVAEYKERKHKWVAMICP